MNRISFGCGFLFCYFFFHSFLIRLSRRFFCFTLDLFFPTSFKHSLHTNHRTVELKFICAFLFLFMSASFQLALYGLFSIGWQDKQIIEILLFFFVRCFFFKFHLSLFIWFVILSRFYAYCLCLVCVCLCVCLYWSTFSLCHTYPMIFMNEQKKILFATSPLICTKWLNENAKSCVRGRERKAREWERGRERDGIENAQQLINVDFRCCFPSLAELENSLMRSATKVWQTKWSSSLLLLRAKCMVNL